MFRRVAGRPVLPCLDLAAWRRSMSRCRRGIVSGVTSSRIPWRCFRYHPEQGREQCPVRPVQARATRLSRLQDGGLVAQDHDLGGLPRVLTLG
jgi:hypothetical protein